MSILGVAGAALLPHSVYVKMNLSDIYQTQTLIWTAAKLLVSG